MQNQNLTIIIDACQSKTRVAAIRDGDFLTEKVSEFQAMESFLASLNELLLSIKSTPANIKEFWLCVGPGSILGTRVASAAICSISKVFGTKIFTWDILATSALTLEKRCKKPVTLCAPSRKNFVNIARADGGKIQEEKEIESANANLVDARLLLQKKTSDKFLAELPVEEFSLSEIFQTLKNDATLLSEAKTPPDAKSLSERNYVKWKAPALI